MFENLFKTYLIFNYKCLIKYFGKNLTLKYKTNVLNIPLVPKTQTYKKFYIAI